jgi:membrane-bound lytic murein transglycosylase D
MRIRRAARMFALLGSFAALGVPLLAGAQGSPAPSAKPKAGAEGAAHRPSKGGGPPAGKAAAAPKAPPKAAAPAKPKKGAAANTKRLPRKPGEAGEPDEATRRIIAGTSGRTVKESLELRAMREIDLALFPSLSPTSGPPWMAEGTPLIDRDEPRLLASGMPPSAKPFAAQPAEATGDLSWLRKLAMPDIPVRWDARVVRYLEYYKNNPRGRSMVQSWIKKSGRYGGAIRRVLREQGLPEDIVWLALVESGFDASIQSPAGAGGLWQFMPEGARIYGLTVDRWIDERLDPERSTIAAARYLADLRQRFGGWELAFAAYNMGYGGLLASIRKYNTNDFWELSRVESGMPLETALYVPKILSMAIVARNKSVFGCEDVELDPAVSFDKIAIRSGVSLRAVALASGASLDRIEELNPQFVASRAPPLGKGDKDGAWTVRVPPGVAPRAAKNLGQYADVDGKLARYQVRWGEATDDIARSRGVSRASLQSLNGIRREEVLRPGTVIFVPADPATGVTAAAAGMKPNVIIPAQAFSYPDRQRLFYRVIPGDHLRDIAGLFGVNADEICRWNLLDPGAALHAGMTLQVFAPRGRSLDNVLVLEEKDARILQVGSAEFFAHFEGQRGRTRVELTAKEGDNWRSIAKRHNLTPGQVERINHKSRSSALSAGDRYVVYVPSGSAEGARPAGPAALTALPEEKAEDTVAVTKPAGDDTAPAAPEEGGARPAVLETPGEPDKPAPEKPSVASDKSKAASGKPTRL